MKTYKEFITELDVETLKSHSVKRFAQADAIPVKNRKGNEFSTLTAKGYKSLRKARMKQDPEGYARAEKNDTRGYDQPNRYHGD
jgi:hypothetical protein